MNRSSVYRADFFRALARAGSDAEERRAVCRLWGFSEKEPDSLSAPAPLMAPEDMDRPVRVPDEPVRPTVRPDERFRFLRCVGATQVPEEERTKHNSTVDRIMAAPRVTKAELLAKDGSPPKPPPLMRWSRLGPFLRKALSRKRRSRQPDVRKVVRLLAEGRALSRIPTMAQTGWHPRLEVWQDRRDDLAPFWDDADFVRSRLIRERGTSGLKWRYVQRDLRAPNGFVLFDPSSLSHENLIVPRGEAAVLVLGDLGQYHGGSLQEAWLALGRKFPPAAREAWVLCPCPSRCWEIPMPRVWNMIQWDRGSRPTRQNRGLPPAPGEEDEGIAILRLLCSAALRVEMGLLRQLRFLVPDGDVGLEYQLFSSKDVFSNATGLAFKDTALKGLRASLPALSPWLAAECLSRIFVCHGYAPVYRHFEMLAWMHWLNDAQWRQVETRGIIRPADQEQSASFYRRLLKSLHSRESGVSGAAMVSFLARDLGRLDETACRDEDRQVAYVLTHDMEAGGPLPDFIDPDVIRPLLPELDCPPVLFHADGLVIGEERRCGRVPTALREGCGACVVSLGEENRTIRQPGDRVLGTAGLLATDDFSIANDWIRVRIERLYRPPWARRMWYDKHGLAAEFRVEGVPFVLRWIPPGRFMMGSPGEEPGRWSGEGPRHERPIEKGFWLGETVVTQAQWRVVMGNNPGHFKGPGTLPVEQVSWNDCRDYCRKMCVLVSGLKFRLPREEEWEYACRAGTDTALWTGGITIRGENDAPELDAIAWYGGNSGQQLEVANPRDAGGWPKRQYLDQQAGVHAVKGKDATPWGLHDMLGNVWEWCDDPWDGKAYEKRIRGEPPMEGDKDAGRVVRGGSWSNLARFCRAACRFRIHPGDRWDSLGFRLAAGQEPEVAEPLGSGATQLAEGRSQPPLPRERPEIS